MIALQWKSTVNWTRRDVERLIENLANAAIDTAKILLVSRDESVPETYREVLLALGKTGCLPLELADHLANLARTGHILAPQYLDIKWEKIQEFLAQGPGVWRQLITTISRRLAKAIDLNLGSNGSITGNRDELYER